MTLLRREPEGARVVEDDPWIALADADPIDGASIDGADVIVPLARWLEQGDALLARAARVGVRVLGEVDPDELGPRLAGASLVVVEFPKFTDGRGYSLARVLRDRHGYRGELRAIGHVLRDQLFYMARCGFETFELAPGRDVDDALRAFEDFSVTYQPAADHQEPIWRRR